MKENYIKQTRRKVQGSISFLTIIYTSYSHLSQKFCPLNSLKDFKHILAPNFQHLHVKNTPSSEKRKRKKKLVDPTIYFKVT